MDKSQSEKLDDIICILECIHMYATGVKVGWVQFEKDIQSQAVCLRQVLVARKKSRN